jgi:hypothetical protein
LNNKKLLTTRNSDSAREATILCVATPLFLAFAGSANPNRAPVAVFIGLGVALAIVGVVLFFAIPVSGEDYRSGGTNYYSGPFGGFGHFGGFGGYL